MILYSRGKKISELPEATELPPENEFIVPVFNRMGVTKAMKVKDLVDFITEEVLNGNEVDMIELENGIRFVKRKNEDLQ